MNKLANIENSIPFTGRRKVNILAIASCKECLNEYYTGVENVEQVIGVTRGEQYLITEVKGFGDVFDVIFVNDNGKLETLSSFFFEDLED